MTTISAYPLAWPVGWRRTTERAVGRFGSKRQSDRGWQTRSDVTISDAVRRVREELQRFGASDDDIVISTNLTLRLDGLPRSNQAAPADPGAAVYWRDSNGTRCIAIDRYDSVSQNLAAVAATLDAMRAIERHGGAEVLDRAFTGFSALPAPSSSATRDWRAVLELTDVPRPTRDDVERAYRRLAALHHPDRGGSAARMTELNLARAQALKDCL